MTGALVGMRTGRSAAIAGNAARINTPTLVASARFMAFSAPFFWPCRPVWRQYRALSSAEKTHLEAFALAGDLVQKTMSSAMESTRARAADDRAVGRDIIAAEPIVQRLVGNKKPRTMPGLFAMCLAGLSSARPPGRPNRTCN